jgi:hypothetical protein
MAFRAGEAVERGYEEVLSYLVPRPEYADESTRKESREFLIRLIGELGPVVEAYPSWHPLVCNHEGLYPQTTPHEDCGYKGLDHTRLFAKGFITCPYTDGQKVIDSVNELPPHPIAHITAERLDVKLYNPDTTAVLIRCNWDKPLCGDGTIPQSIGIPLLLEEQLPFWRFSEVAETWEMMRKYFLGSPHGARSSLFVNSETGQAMKKIWNSLINTGMFGPIYVEKL